MKSDKEKKNKKKVAVILFNLGGPDSLESVQPFLFNLFYDRAIINLPNPFRWLIAKFISSRRTKTAQDIYSLMGGKSPILDETENQALSLKKSLESAALENTDLAGSYEFEIFVCMRYWHPRASYILKKIDEFTPDEVICLPLYPQFSTTTTGSSIKEIEFELKRKYHTKILCCYPEEENFINSHVILIQEYLKKFKKDNFHILFSAHGLPKSIIDSGDPYQWQVENTVKAIVSKLDISDDRYTICYQSRVGPMEWIKPDTEEEIKIFVKKKIPIMVVPIAFVSEHSETLVELDIEYKEIADEAGVQYERVPALSVQKKFIDSLTNQVTKLVMSDKAGLFSPARTCPAKCKRALCRR